MTYVTKLCVKHSAINKVIKAFFLLVTLSGSASVIAEEGELYDPKIKDDEALVRVLNLSEGTTQLALAKGGVKLPKVQPFAFSDYIVVKEGARTFTVGDKKLQKHIGRGTTSTIVFDQGDALTMLSDQSIAKKGKSMIAFYNFANDKNLSLKTANGKTPIVADIAANSSGYREINPVRLKTAVFADVENIKAIDEKQLRRDTPFNIAILEYNGRFITVASDSTVNTRK